MVVHGVTAREAPTLRTLEKEVDKKTACILQNGCSLLSKSDEIVRE
jgi:hydroxymethylpyrimidine pyrophosphatase-like HAD family hydrolase